MATETPTPTPTNTPTVTVTPSITSSVTPTPSITATVTSTVTPTPSITATVTSTVTPTQTQTPTPSLSPFALSAGTVYNECRTCFSTTGCTCTSSTEQSLPHPYWSNNQGRAVIQLGLVQLGGMHGLNS
jgi:hypothetical protein